MVSRLDCGPAVSARLTADGQGFTSANNTLPFGKHGSQPDREPSSRRPSTPAAVRVAPARGPWPCGSTDGRSVRRPVWKGSWGRRWLGRQPPAEPPVMCDYPACGLLHCIHVLVVMTMMMITIIIDRPSMDPALSGCAGGYLFLAAAANKKARAYRYPPIYRT